MSEAEFWSHLEFRVCREFAGLPPALEARSLWCDGFIPLDYFVGETPPRVEGQAWIGRGWAQARWPFTLLLPRRYGSREEINWTELLPPENVTKWVSLGERSLTMEPAAAVPDFD